MTGEPWWASGADGLDPREDPLDAFSRHRAAGSGAHDRSGPERDDGPVDWEPHDRAAWGGPRSSGPTRSAIDDAVEGLGALARAARTARGGRGPGRRAAGERDAVCHGCPWCTFLRAVGEGRPEVVAHFGEAVRHLTLAARAMVDAAEHPTEWQDIPIDEEPS